MGGNMAFHPLASVQPLHSNCCCVPSMRMLLPVGSSKKTMLLLSPASRKLTISSCPPDFLITGYAALAINASASRGRRNLSLLILPVSAVAAEILITFDEAGSAPLDFASTVPLTAAYSSSGVTFSGPSAGQGGAILDEDGGFGVSALSGSNFLAFNRATYATDPETIRFDTLWQTVSIFAAGGLEPDTEPDTFLMEAFDDSDKKVASISSTYTTDWYLLTLTWENGIRKIKLTQTAGDGIFVFDNLRATDSSTPVAEPASMMLLVAGLAGLAGLRSRRRS